jgi:hypothetical protein
VFRSTEVLGSNSQSNDKDSARVLEAAELEHVRVEDRRQTLWEWRIPVNIGK